MIIILLKTGGPKIETPGLKQSSQPHFAKMDQASRGISTFTEPH